MWLEMSCISSAIVILILLLLVHVPLTWEMPICCFFLLTSSSDFFIFLWLLFFCVTSFLWSRVSMDSCLNLFFRICFDFISLDTPVSSAVYFFGYSSIFSSLFLWILQYLQQFISLDTPLSSAVYFFGYSSIFSRSPWLPSSHYSCLRSVRSQVEGMGNNSATMAQWHY